MDTTSSNQSLTFKCLCLNLNYLNSSVPMCVNRPPFPNTAVDISISTNTLHWSLSWYPLDEPHGSDHFPLIIEHNVPFPFPPSTDDRGNLLPKFIFSKVYWPLYSSHLDSLIDLFVFSDSSIDNYDNCLFLYCSPQLCHTS